MHYHSKGRRDLWCEILQYIGDTCSEITSFCDYGCGDGALLEMIHAEYPKAQLYGVDYSNEAIAKTQERKIGSAILIRGRLEVLPHLNVEIGACVQTLEHIQNYKDALLRMASQVHGWMFLSVPNGETDKFGGHYHRWSKDQFHHILETFGDTDTKFSESGNHILARVKRG